jgi:hypothetical protein
MFNVQKLLSAVCLLMAAGVFSVGCNKKEAESPTTKPTEVASDPRIKEGWLYHTEGETHHIRLKIDKTSKELRALVLDGEAKKIQPVTAKSLKLYVLKTKPQVEIVFEPKPEKDDGEGKSSVFVAKGDALPKDVDKKNLEFTTEIEGKSYSFKFDPDDTHGKN